MNTLAAILVFDHDVDGKMNKQYNNSSKNSSTFSAVQN